MRLQCRPAASATATGAHESHSYCPPECAYISASPRTTAIAFAPADPISTSSASSCSATASAAAGGRERLTIMRGGVAPVSGIATGSAVDNVMPSPGRATAPTTGLPSTTIATWTAQSDRGGSENSRVPSTGSMIHVRSALKRALPSLPSSLKIASSGRTFLSSSMMNSCDRRSPSSFISFESAPRADISSRIERRSSPAAVAMRAASR